ncbi:MAG: ferritin-like domain-containing protein [Arcobacter sp.]|nr:ferritin-like domain-containing protein [Arcobacter sp.]
MKYYYLLENIILESKPNAKIKSFKEFYINFFKTKLEFSDSYIPYEMNKPSYFGYLNVILPKNVKNRKYVNTKEGKIKLLHTIAHIEYSAIDLALDSCLRFKNMPMEFYEDWLEVANDEVRHFLMIENLLHDLGSYYGSMDVHDSLFEAMKKTPDLLSRMAVVPRYLEANGLEQNPKIMDKLNSNPDDFNKKILNVLEIILEEEVDHVKKGDKWFKFECNRLNLDSETTYFKILEKIFPGSTQKKHNLNVDLRRQAGFSCNELKILTKNYDCN